MVANKWQGFSLYCSVELYQIDVYVVVMFILSISLSRTFRVHGVIICKSGWMERLAAETVAGNRKCEN